jgi:hypothetical protein
MAIQFVNIVDFNNNQAESFVLENLGSDPTAGNVGRLIYNTATDKVKVDNGTAFVDISGDITEVAAGTYLNGGGTTGVVTLNHDSTTKTDTTSTATPAYGATFTAIDSLSTNATGHVTGMNTKTVTLPAAENYTFNVTGDTGTPEAIASGANLDIAGGTNISTVVGLAADTVTVNLDDSISLSGSLTVGTTGNFTGQVTIPQVPLSGTDAASKHYVDQAVTGALSYQGGYDAATNTPNLDNNPSPNSIKKGWTYTVTVAGLFFTEQVRVGDVLIAEQDAPTALADWTTVQNNIDLADLLTVGIGNVNSDANNNKLGISVSYSNGTADVGLDINGLTEDIAPVDTDTVVIYDGSTSTNKKATLASIADAIDVSKGVNINLDGGDAWVLRDESGGLTTFEVTISNANVLPGASSSNVKAEIISSAGQTVYADVVRTTLFGNQMLNVTFTGSVANGAYRALLVNVG